MSQEKHQFTKANDIEWHSRGYMPHRDHLGLLQSITFRLADSVSQKLLKEIHDEYIGIPLDQRQKFLRIKEESIMDSGLGCCALKNPEVAKVVQETFLKFDGIKYHLIAWCIMPNHVHILIEPIIPLSKIVQSWKSYTGRWALKNNERLNLGIKENIFWKREYWDRYIRNEKHLENVINYIHNNPVKAGLCRKPEDWEWSSTFNMPSWGSAGPEEI